MKVKFWGTRGSTPTSGARYVEFGGNTPCLSVELESTRELVVLDAGSGIRELGNAMLADPDGHARVVHLFLTHAHWDHIQGFPFFAPAYHPDYRINVYCSKDAERFLAGQMSPPYFPVGLEAMIGLARFERLDHQKAWSVGDAVLRSIPLPHPQESTGFRLDENDRALVFATDTEHEPPQMNRQLVEFSRGAQLLVYDAQYTPAEYERGKQGWGHSTFAEGARLAREAGVGELILFSHDPSHDDEACREIEKRGQELFAATRAARQGMVITI
ncbi:MAG: MBL fold metallo-hydrolase [Planctomycetes bacterium]|nr:MBL fold metallo-hydrolase [Planctomycetota bacterium]